MGCNPNCGLLTVATVGAVVAILGGILIPVGNYFIDTTIKKEVVLENGTIGYENWVLPGSPIYREFWVFDVQNPDDVMENGSPPILKQKGPYTYKMRYLPKENITEHEDATLSYLQPNIIIFQPDMSVGPESDTFTTVNLAIVYNGTFDGPYRVYSGKDDINKKGIIVTFNNSRTLQYWTSYCDMVNGTGKCDFVPPFVKKSEELYFFSSDVCRSIYARFEKDVTVKDIPLYRFTIPPLVFASAVVNPDNICFCTEWDTSYNCSMSGILAISNCKQGKPVYLSSPHFLYASSQREFKYVKGMEPKLEDHVTFLDVEPRAKNVKHRFYFPILWLNESAIISDEKAVFFRSKVTSKIKLLNLLQLVLMIVGSVTFLGFLFAFFICKGTNPK